MTVTLRKEVTEKEQHLVIIYSLQRCLKLPPVPSERSLKPVQSEHVVLRRREDEGEGKADFV